MLTTKISVQEKMAELEARIDKLEQLEAQRIVRNLRINHVFFGESWRKMWEHFDEVMKKL